MLEPKLMEYHGPPYVIFNKSANCLKGLEDVTETLLLDECATSNSHDVSLKLWRVLITTHNVTSQDVSTFKRSPGYNLIYCFPWSITIGDETVRCSTMMFQLSDDISFKFRNQIYIGRKRKLVNLRFETPFVTDVPAKAHFSSGSLANSDVLMFDRIQELTRSYEKLSDEHEVSIVVSKHGTAWWTTIAFVATLCLGLIVLTVMNYNLSQRLHLTNKVLASDVAELKTYAPVSCVNCARSQSSPVQTTQVVTSGLSSSDKKDKPNFEVGCSENDQCWASLTGSST